MYSSQDVNILYTAIGKNIWKIQHLENIVATFTSMVILQKRRNQSKKTSEEYCKRVLEKQKKQTLGPMIRTAKEQGTIPPELAKQFQTLLQERNWIVHNCVSSDMFSLRSQSKKKELLNRLENCSDLVFELMSSMAKLHEQWFSGLGYDMNVVQQRAKKLLKDAESG